MFCYNCGNELPEGAKFCFKCGAGTAEGIGLPDLWRQWKAIEKLCI